MVSENIFAKYMGGTTNNNSSQNKTSNIWSLIKEYIKTHHIDFIFILAILIYIIIVQYIYFKNPFDLINEDNGGASIFLSLFGGFLILITYLFYKRRKFLFGNNTDSTSTMSYYGKIFSSIFTAGLLIAIIYFLFTLSSNYSDYSVYFMYILNIIIFFGLITLIFKTLGIKNLADIGNDKPSWIKLIFKLFAYIPCLILQFIDFIKYQYSITTHPVIILLIGEIALIALYFILPSIMKIIYTHDSKQLLTEVENINQERKLASFQEVNFVDEKFQYHYAISAWIYIDSFPPETNPSYSEYTSILNIGNKPNIEYNVEKNKLRIKMENQGKEEQILYETKDFYMQKWNNIIINYDGSVLDIFINNNLVSTTPGTVPYNGNTVITTGTTDGIYGRICNVNYYSNSISRGKINWLYNSVKNKNPPQL